MALSDRIGRIPRGEGAKQLRHTSKRRFYRHKGACSVLGEVRYLTFDRAVAVLRTHEEDAVRFLCKNVDFLC